MQCIQATAPVNIWPGIEAMPLLPADEHALNPLQDIYFNGEEERQTQVSAMAAKEILKASTACSHPKATLRSIPPPPRHYSADVINIEFWCNPSAVAAVLPTGLDPDPVRERSR
jgi:hypothetical protein